MPRTNARSVKQPAAPAPPPDGPQPLAEDADTRSRLIGAAVRMLAEMRDHRMQISLALITAVNREHGCATPFESFIYELGCAYRSTGAITPDMVREDLKVFEENFTDAIAEANALARQYPGLVVANV